MHRISIIGIGRIGGALAVALYRKGIEIGELIYRAGRKPVEVIDLLESSSRFVEFSPKMKLSGDVVIITTADPEISAAAAQISNLNDPPSIVLHTSGSLSSDILRNGAGSISVGSMHPLISVSDPIRGAERFANAYFCIEGDDAAVNAASEIVKTLGGKGFTIETQHKALYHAAAVMSSGHLVALEDTAMSMLSRAGIPEHSAKDILMPLIQSTIENLTRQPNEQALTGSFARGDAGAVKRHIAAIENDCGREEMEIYISLGLRSLAIAKRNSTDPAASEMITEIISIAKDRLR